MKNEQTTQELQSSTQGEQKLKQPIEAPVQDSGSASASSNDGRKVSREDIIFVQNLIERFLQLYMSKDEVVKTLLSRARIDPGFTSLVWQKLEEENAEFFRGYYIRMKLKRQIVVFNHLLEHQYQLTKYHVHGKAPLVVPMQNGIHPMAPVNNMPMGYPVLQQHPQMHARGHPHLDPMGGVSSCHVVSGIPAPANFQPMRMNSGNDMGIDTTVADPTPMIPPSSGMSDVPVSPASAASGGHFPFAASDMPGMGMDTAALETAFTSDVTTSVGLQLESDGGAGSSRDPLRPFDQIPWDFSLSDLTDLSNLGDLGALENYPGSPFLPSDSDLMLDSPEQDDIDEFLVDPVPEPPCPQSEEDKL